MWLFQNRECASFLVEADAYEGVKRIAGKVADDKYLATREQFNRAFKVHEDYEQILRENNQENGQVTIAYKVITDAYEVRLRDHTFLEDLRGYTKNEN